MAKRSCDSCVRRKTRCDAQKPCKPCATSKVVIECTYRNPILKRGPKSPRRKPATPRETKLVTLLPNTDIPRVIKNRTNERPVAASSGDAGLLRPAVFAPILSAYESRMYPVWPILDVALFNDHLAKADPESREGRSCYIVATALSAATIAQLKLGCHDSTAQKLSAAMMEEECTMLRAKFNYREHATVDSVLASFFLHVYHAKVDNRKAAMMYLQEAISFARLLLMHIPEPNATNGDIIYTLLWVSER